MFIQITTMICIVSDILSLLNGVEIMLLHDTLPSQGNSVLNGNVFACNVGELDSIPGSGTSTGDGNGDPFQYPCQENPMDRGAL